MGYFLSHRLTHSKISFQCFLYFPRLRRRCTVSTTGANTLLQQQWQSFNLKRLGSATRSNISVPMVVHMDSSLFILIFYLCKSRSFISFSNLVLQSSLVFLVLFLSFSSSSILSSLPVC